MTRSRSAGAAISGTGDNQVRSDATEVQRVRERHPHVGKLATQFGMRQVGRVVSLQEFAERCFELALDQAGLGAGQGTEALLDELFELRLGPLLHHFLGAGAARRNRGA